MVPINPPFADYSPHLSRTASGGPLYQASVWSRRTGKAYGVPDSSLGSLEARCLIRHRREPAEGREPSRTEGGRAGRRGPSENRERFSPSFLF